MVYVYLLKVNLYYYSNQMVFLICLVDCEKAIPIYSNQFLLNFEEDYLIM